MRETTLRHFVQQVRALPDAQWGCLLWDDARAFKSDAIGSRKKKGEIPREGWLPNPLGQAGPEIEPDRRMVPLFRRQAGVDRDKLAVQGTADRLDADVTRERR